MNMSPVSRLKKTWSKVKTAKFFILEVKYQEFLVLQMLYIYLMHNQQLKDKFGFKYHDRLWMEKRVVKRRYLIY